ncbi:MAG: DUF1203 domain-containing protein [Candidatus Eisenbacteria bacterium]
MSATTAPPTTSFRIIGLPLAPFAPLFALTDSELATRGMRRVVADSNPGYPCRVSLADAEPGETLILLSHVHHDVAGPYRASGPVYVREAAAERTLAAGEVPDVVATRLLSIRAYDDSDMLLAATVAEGREFATVVCGMFAEPDVAYVHAHNAKPGCFSCRIERAS